MKIQWICDLKNSAVEHVSLSGFTRNDQAAAPDILEVAQPGDLVLRDLGYLVTVLLPQMTVRGILFLSRYRHDIDFHDPQTGQPFDLSARLRFSPTLGSPAPAGAGARAGASGRPARAGRSGQPCAAKRPRRPPSAATVRLPARSICS